MREARLVPASLLHVGPLSHRLRDADRRECEALGRKPKDALRMSLRTSLHALTALDEDGKVLAMMGVCSEGLMTGKGVPWFLGSDETLLYGRDLMSRGPKIIRWWLEDFEVMKNIVSSENAMAIKLLRKWGAEVGGEPQMHRGLEFVPFVFRRSAIQAPAAAP